MSRLHVFEALPKEDERQAPDGSRVICTTCGVLRANRFGGGHIYSATDGRFWERRRPDCTAKESA